MRAAAFSVILGEVVDIDREKRLLSSFLAELEKEENALNPWWIDVILWLSIAVSVYVLMRMGKTDLVSTKLLTLISMSVGALLSWAAFRFRRNTEVWRLLKKYTDVESIRARVREIENNK